MGWHVIKLLRMFAALLALLAATQVHAARGVTPYLPLNLAPELEQQIERVLILGDKPVLKRPFAAATVLDALPKACAVDLELCQSVRAYLGRYMGSLGVPLLAVEAAITSDEAVPADNRRGLTTDAEWLASAQAYFRPNDYVALSLGGVAYPHEVDLAGTLFSVGLEYAQLDVGFRDRWLSPFKGNAMLLSTEAQTMPSVTLSNYTPITRLGFSYELFIARMSESERIVFRDGFTRGNPRLAGMHLGIEPVSGWALGVNRILQFGGGARGGDSLDDLVRAFFRPSRYDNRDEVLSGDDEFGNQVASFTSRLTVPGPMPVAVYFEYAGEDTSRGRDYLLGNSALSMGIDIPQLLPNVRFTYEASEWQNTWYQNAIYLDGLTHEGRVIGHWGAAHRAPDDAVGAQAHMLQVGWTPPVGGLVEARYRTLANESYGTFDYERLHDFTLRYSRDWRGLTLGAELQAGRDVFGEDYQRFAAFVHYPHAQLPNGERSYRRARREGDGVFFVDLGLSAGRIDIDLTEAIPTEDQATSSLHAAVGVRRAVSERSDLGARLEIDDVDGHMLLAVRALDYGLRITRKIDLSVFAGAARYDLATPAFGMYYGIGARWRDVLPQYDIGVDLRYADKVARDRLLPGEPLDERPDSFYDIALASVYLTRRW